MEAYSYQHYDFKYRKYLMKGKENLQASKFNQENANGDINGNGYIYNGIPAGPNQEDAMIDNENNIIDRVEPNFKGAARANSYQYQRLPEGNNM